MNEIFTTSCLLLSTHLSIYNSDCKKYICKDNAQTVENSKQIFYFISSIKSLTLGMLFLYNFLTIDHVNINRVNYQSPFVISCLNGYAGGALYDIYVYIFHKEVKPDILFHHSISLLALGLIIHHNSHIYYISRLLLLNMNTFFLNLIFYFEYFPQHKLYIYICAPFYILTYICFRIIHVPYILYIHYTDYNDFVQRDEVNLYYAAVYFQLLAYTLQLFWSYKIYRKCKRMLTSSP